MMPALRQDQDEWQHGTLRSYVCGFSGRSAEKPHTNKIKYRSAEGYKLPTV
jgi:hypothetical protein